MEIDEMFDRAFDAQGAGDDDLALGHFLEALRLGEALDDAEAVVSAALEAEAIYARRLEFEAALALAEKAQGHAVRSGLPMNEALAANAMAELLCHLGRANDAAVLHQEAAEIAKAESEPLAAAWFLSNAGWAYQELERFDDAIAAFEEAVELAETASDATARLGHEKLLATALADVGRYDDAAEIIDDLDNIDPDDWAENRAAGHVLARMGSVEGALIFFSRAMNLMRAEGNLLEERCCLREMARLGLP